jgi:DNA-binding transcriptional LysR family regulator
MYDWGKLRVFYAVAQAQSLTKAGQMLNLSQSAVSRQVSGLEEQMGVTLFHRHARGLLLTEQGEILYRTVSEISHKLKVTETALMDSRERPRGPLTVTAPVAIGTSWLVPHLAEFSELYPEITVSLIVSDKGVDVAMREADCALQLYEAKNPDVIQRKLSQLHRYIFASNDYLRKYGTPNRPGDLQHHKIITYGEGHRPPDPSIDWILSVANPQGERLHASFKVNGLLGMLRAVEHGMGIAGLPDYLVRNSDDVSHILPNIQGPALDMYFIYASELRYSKRIAVFRDFLIRKVAEMEF